MPEWRNGRRAGLKIQWPSGRVGSTPTSGIADRSAIPECVIKAVAVLEKAV